MKKVISILLIMVLALGVFWCAGRYGWKLCGFKAAEGANIEEVSVSENQVEITGVCPGLVPRGFIGYLAEEKDGCLYVGYRFSGLFGFFETGRFTITIPVKDNITKVYTKTASDETLVWEAQ